MSRMDGIYEPHWQIGLAPLPIGKCPMGKTKRPMTKNHVPHEEIKTPHGFCGDTPFAAARMSKAAPIRRVLMGEKSVSAVLENGSAKIKNGTATFRFGTDTHKERH